MSPFATWGAVEPQDLVVALTAFIGSRTKGGDGALDLATRLFDWFAGLKGNHLRKGLTLFAEHLGHTPQNGGTLVGCKVLGLPEGFVRGGNGICQMTSIGLMDVAHWRLIVGAIDRVRLAGM
jgi:hypothetical protein